MSERAVMRQVAALLLALAVLGVRAAAAQSAGDYAVIVDSLAAIASAADARLAAHNDSAARRESRQDTIIAGPVLLLVSASLTQLVTAARDSAVAALRGPFGATLDQRPRDRYALFPQTFHASHADSARVVAFARVDESGHRSSPFNQPTTVRDVATGIRAVMLSTLSSAAGPAMRSWIGQTLPIDTANQNWLARQRLQLASAPARVARDCYDGDIAACRKAFGFTAVQDPLTELYDAPTRRLLVRERATRFSRDARPQVDRCITGADTACLAVLRGSAAPGDPLPHQLHTALMQIALEMGGPGAYARIVDRGLDPAQGVAAVAGAPLDSVLATWHARVIEARAPSSSLTGGMAAASLFWMAVCAGLALRSSRWR